MDSRVEFIKLAMQNARGDNLPRAQRAFGGMSIRELNLPYGDSGKTYGQILEEYRQQDQKWQDAMALLHKVLPEITGY